MKTFFERIGNWMWHHLVIFGLLVLVIGAYEDRIENHKHTTADKEAPVSSERSIPEDIMIEVVNEKDKKRWLFGLCRIDRINYEYCDDREGYILRLLNYNGTAEAYLIFETEKECLAAYDMYWDYRYPETTTIVYPMVPKEEEN